MHIIQGPKTKKTFCWPYTKYTRKLLSVSLKASVKRRTEPLNDRCFDFTDEFKHSELSHLPCKLQYNTRNQSRKGKLLWDCFYLKVKSQKGGLPARQLGLFFCHPKMKAGRWGQGAAAVQPWWFQILILFSKQFFADLLRFKLSQK